MIIISNIFKFCHSGTFSDVASVSEKIISVKFTIFDSKVYNALARVCVGNDWACQEKLLLHSSTSTNDEDEAVLAREEEGSEENHEYFKFLQNEKEGSLPCAASLFHSHTPQVVPVKRYYTHLTEPAVVGVQVFLMQQNV